MYFCIRTVEPKDVFKQIKYDGHFRRIRNRGNKMATAELATVAIKHNIKKMIYVMNSRT